MTADTAEAVTPFDVGDDLVYPQHGAARVVERTSRQVQGDEKDYLVLDVLLDEMRVWVPVDGLDEIGVRPPTPEEDLEDLFDVLSERDVRIPSNFSRRFKNNQKRLNEGDVWQLAEVVRNLAIRRAERHLSPSEKTMFEHAHSLLAAELALTLDTSPEAAAEKIDDHLPDPDED